MSFLGAILSVGKLRKALWRFWYPFLTRRVGAEPVLFLNYAFEEDPPLNILLTPEDAPHRACVQLYHHVAGRTGLEGKDVLEVGCGHGGGASYLARTFKPRSYVGLDLNPAGIRFCRERHHVDGLSFREGDAEDLPFPDGTFDAVINVESSHCYPNFGRFLSEVARVLRPGGHFLYADFRFEESAAAWEAALASCPMKVIGSRDITGQVLRGMELNSERSLALVDRFLPRFLGKLGRDFAGVKGSLVHAALLNGGAAYRSFHFQKTI